MNALRITAIALSLLLLALGAEFLLKIKKSKDRPVDEVRRSLTVRLDITMLLIAALTVVTIIAALLHA